MFASWKIYLALGAIILLGTLAWAADHYRSKARLETERADRAEEALARASAVIDFQKKNAKALAEAVAVKAAADKIMADKIESLKKKIRNDPQASDPAPRVIRRALGRLPE